MPHLTLCTLTGADETTEFNDLASLHRVFPFVEFAFLFSPDRAGAGGRYPSVAWLHAVLARAKHETPAMHVAVHFCGRSVHELVNREQNSAAMGLLQHLDTEFGSRARVQLNFNLKRLPTGQEPGFLHRLAALIEGHPRLTFITQRFPGNLPVLSALPDLVNHVVLFDGSGGRGVSPVGWEAPVTSPTGYAGGLGPHNLAAELVQVTEAIQGSATPQAPFWVDMESSLRNAHDQFDLSCARACLELVAAHLQTQDTDCS